MKKPFIQNFIFCVASEARLIDAITGFPVLTVTAIKQISDEIWRCYVTASERKLKKKLLYISGEASGERLTPRFQKYFGSQRNDSLKFETIV